MAKHPSRVRRPVSRAALFAAFGVTFTLVSAERPVAARDILRGSGSASSATANEASTAANSVSAQTAETAKRAQDTLLRAAQALQSVQTTQNLKRAAALAASSSVPNGLQSGGLVPDPGAAADVLKAAAAQTVWVGSSLPVQTESNGQTNVTITQNQQQAYLNWQSFNIGKNTNLYFDQSAGGSDVGTWIAFNKVTTGVPSQILGSIKAAGQVYVINQNGIIFGGSSQVNVHALVASSLPINPNLVASGILNNTNNEFLFDQAFSASSSSFGDVVVEQGAELVSPTTADHVGGKIVLVGPNVTNAGTISTPDGQAILAAGLQVGFASHNSNDSSLRGLDVFIGQGGGTAENSADGLIDAPRASVTMAGKTVNQLGVIHSTTSVSLNGRIDLLANYDAESQPSSASGSQHFLPNATGVVTLGAGSVTEILPETDSSETLQDTKLKLTSLINIQGRAIHMEADSLILAPGAALPTTFTAYDGMGAALNAGVSLSVGEWNLDQSSTPYQDTFMSAGGQIYLDAGATISVAGLTNVSVPVTENLVSLKLLASELADSPVQRAGVFYQSQVTIDARVGTPLANMSGAIDLIKRNVGELSINGGTVSMSAGESVVLQQGSNVDVSGGWLSYQGGTIKTTRVLLGGNLFDISQATADRIYDGIYSGYTETHSKWGVTSTYTSALLNGSHYEAGYVQGANGGSLSITAPAMALDGDFFGNTVTGLRQRSAAPSASSLTLAFKEQKMIAANSYIWASPAQAYAMDMNTGDSLLIEPRIVIADESSLPTIQAFALDASSNPVALQEYRRTDVFFSTEIINHNGFGNVSIDNSDGNILLPTSAEIKGTPGGSLTLTAANITLDGKIEIAGGKLSFTVYDYSPLLRKTKLDGTPTPLADATRGAFTLGSSAVLDTAGLIVDDRSGAPSAETLPLVTNGGSVTIQSFTADLQDGSLINVSGGVAVGENGKASYGDAGAITIEAGRDPNLTALVGGKLHLGSTLIGDAGVKEVTIPYARGIQTVNGASMKVSVGRAGGSLSILAPLIQIGGSNTADSDVLYLDSGFFNQGGFSSFTLKGLGQAVTDPLTGISATDPTTGEILYTPAVRIAAGTNITPTIENQVAVLGEAGSISMRTLVLPEAMRTTASLTFKALGIKDSSKTIPLVARGDLIMEKGSTIDAGLQGSVTFDNSSTVTVLGSIFAPGGSITISGASNSNNLFANSSQALSTVVLGSQSVLDVSGALLLIDDARGYRTGSVLPGGSITVSGNITASSGAILDVSGASGVLDLPGTYSGESVYLSGGVSRIPVKGRVVESDAGTITLTGGQELYSDATLLGFAGGASAQGGSLVVSSGYFPPATQPNPVIPTALSPTLVVTQSGLEIAKSYYSNGEIGIGAAISDADQVLDVNGNPIMGIGHFTVGSFTSGDFDSLTLKGTVLFKSAVSIEARRNLTVASGGVIFADSDITLSGQSIAIGASVLNTPQTADQYLNDYTARSDNQQLYTPTYGSGSLTVNASLIDIGNLSLRNIGTANFNADGGDIRGSGTLDVAGDITLRAGQIYPPTASSFTIAAYDHGDTYGSVTIVASGKRQTPLSAGGELNIYASIITQGGVLRAPLGTINLGWNGVDAAPVDSVTGQLIDMIAGTPYDATQALTLLAGSVTSVSAAGLTIPYGVTLNGSDWIDPTGTSITTSGPPAKTIHLSAVSIEDKAVSTIDLSGGGDLYSYSFVKGTGGSTDVLLSTSSFAVIPGYDASYAPSGAYNSAPTTTYLGSDPGYTNSSLKVGDQVYLNASTGLPSGYYTLLPARYALLSGAFLVTPKSGMPTGAVSLTDNSSLVSGYRVNNPGSSENSARLYSRFEVASSSVIRSRADYSNYSGNDFFKKQAQDNNSTTPRLPVDSGRLVLAASQSLEFGGSVSSAAGSGGRGSLVDISSPGDILIAGEGVTAGNGTLVIAADTLNAIGADSLLIGGLRSTDSDGIHVTVTAGQLTVDNAGNPLTGTDIILAASESLTLAPGSEIKQAGSLSSATESLLLTGDGALVRVSADALGQISRSGIPASSAASLNIGAGVHLSGVGLTLDSSYATLLDPTAALNGNAVSLHSGQISLEFGGQGLGDLKQTAGQTTRGLVLSGEALRTLMASTKSLSLLSYSSIDLYGTGQVGDATFAGLSLHAAEIRGFNQSNVTFAAQSIVLDNYAKVGAPAAVDGPSTGLEGSLTFEGKTIQLGVNQLNIGLYSNVALNASGAFVAQNVGGLATQGNLSITTPLVTGATAANQTVSAAGALTIQTAGGSGDTSLTGLGATLVLQGHDVSADTRIWLPSGLLKLHATGAVGGDVAVGGRLDVGGTYKIFYDVAKYTNAGQITLTSDFGNVNLGAGSSVNVAAQAESGDAGTLTVNASNGTFTSAGTLAGSSGKGGLNGVFSLDVGRLPSTAGLDAILDAAAFTNSRSIRVQMGDVAIDGPAQAHSYQLSADEGSITVTSILDASGSKGGSIFLAAHGSVILKDGAELTVKGVDFDSAGKGGSVTLEAGDSSLDTHGNYTHDTNVVVDIQSGSTIDLSVASVTAASASLGRFTGTLHLRAPQNASQTDLQMNPINGSILGASSIVVEGYRVYNPTGGAIDSVLASILANGNAFVGPAGSAAAGYNAMLNRLVQNNAGLRSLVSIRPGAEIVNLYGASGSLTLQLNTASSSLTVAPDTAVTFPSGTPGTDTITTNANGIITLPDGSTRAIISGVATSLAAGSSITFANSVGNGTITFKSGSTAIPILLPSASNFATAGTTTIVPSGNANTIQLAAVNSKITVAVGVTLSFPNGTPGDDKIKSSVAGTITLADGTTKTLVANTSTALAAGSTVKLSGSGSITYASGTTGGAIPITLPTSGSYAMSGATNISTSVSDLTLGTTTSTAISDWNLSTYRFGPNSAPGVLTLRAAGNIRLYNALSDGFVTSDFTAQLSAMNALLPANSQSWSYRIVSGADFTGSDFSDVQPLDDLDANSGSLLLGKNSTGLASSPGTNASTSATVKGYYQVIRTGSGDIDIYAGRSVKLLNQFATIYTAGTRIPTPTTIWTAGDFVLPKPSLLGSYIDPLGAIQETTPYAVQYSLGGGDVTIKAQEDIKHQTVTRAGEVSDDSERQLPMNWLYRRGYVDPSTGLFGASKYGEIASTTWWVDFSNFFEGVGALGGGNVTLIAGHDIKNVDAAIPTNARMPKGTPDASQLLELGGGNLSVRAGHDINGGVYYVERGNGTLSAGNSILTNSTRIPSAAAVSSADGVDAATSNSWLPTTLFLGKGNFDVSAVSDLLMGPVANVFLLPEGYSNTYWYKSYFSTYAPSDVVSVSSLTGNVTLRESATTTSYTSTSGGTTAVPILEAWLDNVLRFSSTSASNYQPWLRLDESDVVPFTTAASLMPGTLLVAAYSGDINAVGSINLSPSPTGTLDLLAAASINGLARNGVSVVNGQNITDWGTSSINLSDANPNALPGVASPYAYQELMGTTPSARATVSGFLNAVLDVFFAESGSTEGAQGSLQTRQALHASGVLHANDNVPVHVYAGSGDISGFTLYSSKATQIVAGNDITDIAFYLQNARAGDVSIVSAGRDIIAFDAASAARQIISNAKATNQLNDSDIYPLSGDIHISGPGTLEVLAGRNLDLGSTDTNPTLASDLGLGITSIGNARNPYLPFEGADIIAAAGIGSSAGLNQSELGFEKLITQFLNPATSGGYASLYLPEMRSTLQTYLQTDLSSANDDQLWTAFGELTKSQQDMVALSLFYTILRDEAHTYNDPSSPGYQYKLGYAAIAALFPGEGWQGNISFNSREIKTKNGISSTTSDGQTVYTRGNISILAPGGAITVGAADTTGLALEQGIITEHGGQISSFSKQSLNIGNSSRIFTMRGGDIIIWSTLGDIAAGAASKTVKSAPPSRVMFDPQSADVKTDLGGLATGGGIGVLATVTGVAPGNIYPIAPNGTVDAGDAGISATGNIYIAAMQVLNAGNVQSGGVTVGTPSAAAAPNIGSLTSASNTVGGAMNSSENAANQARIQSATVTQGEMPSIITVEVIGYGGGED